MKEIWANATATVAQADLVFTEKRAKVCYEARRHTVLFSRLSSTKTYTACTRKEKCHTSAQMQAFVARNTQSEADEGTSHFPGAPGR